MLSDVRARAMRRHAAAAGSSSTTTTRALLRYLRGDGVEVLATVARDAAAARRALATTTTATTRDLTSDAPSPSRWCASPFVASWRGFAAGAHRPAGGARGGRGGRGGGNLAAAIKLNGEIVASRSAAELLSIVAERGGDFNEVNVATAVNKLAKVARERDNLRGDPRYARLLELVRLRCRELQARHVANVVHGLGVLCADKGAGDVDADTAGELIRMVERNAGGSNSQNVSNVYNGLTKLTKLGKIDAAAEAVSSGAGWSRLIGAAERLAPEMNSQNIANVLNALGKIEAAAGAVSSAGWSHFATAVERTSGAMNAQDVSNVVNAYTEMRMRVSEAPEAVSDAGWRSLAAAARRTAPAMTSQNIALTVDAAKKLDAFAMAIDDDGWNQLARQVPRVARDFNAQEVVLVLSAVGWKLELAKALAPVDGGWDALIAGVERHLDAIKKGWIQPDLGRQARKSGHSIMLISELDGGAFTDERLERVRGELEEMLRADPIQWKRYEEDIRRVRASAAAKAAATVACKPKAF